MKNNKGYTAPELLVVVVVLGLFSFLLISKASYAFENTSEVSETTEEMILEKSATAYAESIKETVKSEKTKYITGNDLIEAGYLASDSESKIAKIKLEYDEVSDTISVSVIK